MKTIRILTVTEGLFVTRIDAQVDGYGNIYARRDGSLGPWDFDGRDEMELDDPKLLNRIESALTDAAIQNEEHRRD